MASKRTAHVWEGTSSSSSSSSDEIPTVITKKVKKGKKHPPAPKPRPPPPSNEEETPPPTAADLECSTSEDENDYLRRAPPRQSKKQKRAQKQQEIKEDRAVLGEMKNPLPSTSGPLAREQEKIKLMHPKKFLPQSGRIATVVQEVSPRPSEGGSAVKENDNDPKSSTGATRPKIRIKDKKEASNRSTVERPTRSSTRHVKPNADAKVNNVDDNRKEMPNSPQQEQETVEVVSIKQKEIAPKKQERKPEASPVVTKPKVLVPTPPVTRRSVPIVEEPVLKEKRQRRLPKRLMSPEMSDVPPVLFRIASSGSINLVDDNDEGPPQLKPMVTLAPPSPRTKKRPGKENQNKPIAKKNKVENQPDKGVSPMPIPEDCDLEEDKEDNEKTEGGGEPARKRVARTKTTSSTETPGRNRNSTRNTPQDAHHEGPKLRTRSRSGMSSNS